MARHDNVLHERHGQARQGKERQGKARQGKARQGKALLGSGRKGRYGESQMEGARLCRFRCGALGKGRCACDDSLRQRSLRSQNETDSKAVGRKTREDS